MTSHRLILVALLGAVWISVPTTTRSQVLPPGGAVLELAEQLVGTSAGQRTDPVPLSALVELVRHGNPEIAAARRLAAAAAAQVPQAGALPDPMLTAGLMNAPAFGLDLSQEPMTMWTLQLSQRIPAWGTRGLREDAARSLHSAALLEAEETEVAVIARLKAAYHELVFAHQAQDVLRRNASLLENLADVAAGRLAVGSVPQQDVLRAQTEVTRIEAQLSVNAHRRAAALAELNAILDRHPLDDIVPEYPPELLRIALARPPEGAFTAAALGAGIGGGFPDLQALLHRALLVRPALLAHMERIGAMNHGYELALRERRPGMGWMVAYSPRLGRGDLVNLGVSMDLPIFRGRKQDQAVLEAREVLSEHEFRHHRMVAEIRSEVARRYSALVRNREGILLLSEGVIPQAGAAVESALGAYQASRMEFAGLLEAQATLFRNEIEIIRLLADFGREAAALERAVGEEVDLPLLDADTGGANPLETMPQNRSGGWEIQR